MNACFYESHLKTIVDLQKIAEKHNMSIHFGFDSDSSDEHNEDLLRNCKVDECIIKDLSSYAVTLNRVQHDMSKLWFELYDKQNDKFHTMAYIEESLYFEIKDYESENVSAEFEDFVDVGEYEGLGFYSFRNSPTIITGFGNKSKVKDFRCYREGMALKFFGDLVCDFLGEERICRTY